MALCKLLGPLHQRLVTFHYAVVMIDRIDRWRINSIDGEEFIYLLFLRAAAVAGSEHINIEGTWRVGIIDDLTAENRRQLGNMFAHAADHIGRILPRYQKNTHKFSCESLPHGVKGRLIPPSTSNNATCHAVPAVGAAPVTASIAARVA